MSIMKPILAVLLAFILLGACPLSAGDEIKYPPYKRGLVNLGVSYGNPYSQMIGIRAEVTPKGIFGYQLGLGVALLKQDFFDKSGAFHLGWSIGATAYAFGNDAKFTPFLSLIDYMKALQSGEEKSYKREKEGLQHGHIFWMRRS
jgi:hypothetical protein